MPERKSPPTPTRGAARPKRRRAWRVLTVSTGGFPRNLRTVPTSVFLTCSARFCSKRVRRLRLSTRCETDCNAQRLLRHFRGHDRAARMASKPQKSLGETVKPGAAAGTEKKAVSRTRGAAFALARREETAARHRHTAASAFQTRPVSTRSARDARVRRRARHGTDRQRQNVDCARGDPAPAERGQTRLVHDAFEGADEFEVPG